jgi:hypothetical protein
MRVISPSKIAAMSIRIATKIRGEEYGIPYLTPIKPVLQRNTKPAGASLAATPFIEVAFRIQ